jgi:hypothetical protein
VDRRQSGAAPFVPRRVVIRLCSRAVLAEADRRQPGAAPFWQKRIVVSPARAVVAEASLRCGAALPRTEPEWQALPPFLILAAGRGSWLACDLLRSGSKPC